MRKIIIAVFAIAVVSLGGVSLYEGYLLHKVNHRLAEWKEIATHCSVIRYYFRNEATGREKALGQAYLELLDSLRPEVGERFLHRFLAEFTFQVAEDGGWTYLLLPSNLLGEVSLEGTTFELKKGIWDGISCILSQKKR